MKPDKVLVKGITATDPKRCRIKKDLKLVPSRRRGDCHLIRRDRAAILAGVRGGEGVGEARLSAFCFAIKGGKVGKKEKIAREGIEHFLASNNFIFVHFGGLGKKESRNLGSPKGIGAM